jgi:ribosome-associated protein
MTEINRADAALVAALKALDERKVENLVILDLRGRLPYSDFFIVGDGHSERQVRSLAEAVEGAVRDACGLKPRKEGTDSAEWILLDYGDLLVHLFTIEARAFYRLDRLWGDAPRLRLDEALAEFEAR